MSLTLLWLLLPVAAASGWFFARRDSHRSNVATGPGSSVSTNYLKGINYLLNEQPDKAISVFIDMLDVDSDTVETHLALGNLFRRRGEVERAIRIHQNIIARPTLDSRQRSEALFELGQDYMKAGLLDRAENLFNELTGADSHRLSALKLLQEIYQQEKDWEKAIATARRRSKLSGRPIGIVVAHYYCELARRALLDNQAASARSYIKQALAADRRCARASILLGQLESGVGNYRAALRAYQRIEQQAPALLNEVIEDIKICFEKLDQHKELLKYLQRILRSGEKVTQLARVNLVYTRLLEREQGTEQAFAHLRNWLSGCPSFEGLELLLDLEERQQDTGAPTVAHQQLKEIIGKMGAGQKRYRCQHCGFSGRIMHWQCPSCKQWGVFLPQPCLDVPSGSPA